MRDYKNSIEGQKSIITDKWIKNIMDRDESWIIK